MYTIKQASERTGIPPATLRAWERRYAVLRPPRSAGGYRLYDDASIRDLEVMTGLVALGRSPRQAADEVAARRARPGSAPDRVDAGEGAAPTIGPALPPIGPALAAVHAQDARALSRAAEVAFAAGPLPEVLRTWLFPLLVAVGDAWADGDLSVAAEHGASHVLMRVLADRLDDALPAQTEPVALVGLPVGARHEIGALAFAAVAAQHGMPVAYLGADLPVPDWLAAVRTTGARAAVVAVPTRADLRAARQTVTALGGLPDLVIGVGGGAQSGIRPPAVALGHDLQAAVDTLRDLLRPRPPAR
ncbi:MAG: MerR family transcriptional regulator [Dermatophilaceae bacterium]